MLFTSFSVITSHFYAVLSSPSPTLCSELVWGMPGPSLCELRGVSDVKRCACRFFETFSYLPPLSDAEIAKQVDYIVNNGFIACLEFAEAELAYVGSQNMGECPIPLSRNFPAPCLHCRVSGWSSRWHVSISSISSSSCTLRLPNIDRFKVQIFSLQIFATFRLVMWKCEADL